jgi:hypothetical protein
MRSAPRTNWVFEDLRFNQLNRPKKGKKSRLASFPES